MILDIYKDAFEFASKKISILFVLGVLSFFNILIIPAVFFYGYNYRVVKLSTQSMINVISYLGILLISVTIFIVVFVILSFVVALFDMAVPIAYGNFIGSLLIWLVLLFIVAPYLSLFQTRCAGLIYNI